MPPQSSDSTPTPAAETEGLRLEYVPLHELLRWPRNAKDHDIPELERSFARFGFTNPMIVDDTTGRLVAGHGRLEALQGLKEGRQQPPANIRVTSDGHWLVPVVRGARFQSEAEAEAYVVADNMLTIAGGWIEDLLTQSLKAVHDETGSLDGTGFAVEDLDKLLRTGWKEREVNAEPPTPRPSELEALVAKWGTERGQLWKIGQHRILCGDSTDPADVTRATGGARPALMWSDPPYGIDYVGHQAEFGAIAGDKAPLVNYLPLAVGIPAWYVCCRWDVAHAFMQAIIEDGYTVRNWIVWEKSRGGQGDTFARYSGRHETILYAEAPEKKRKRRKTQADRDAEEAARPTAEAPKEDRRSRGRDYRQEHETVLYASRDRIPFMSGGRDSDIWHHAPDPANAYLHPTQKPVALPARAIRNHTRVGDTVYDPFLGSGASIIAAEQLDRRGVGIELDPRYVAASLERLSIMGLEPVREGSE